MQDVYANVFLFETDEITYSSFKVRASVRHLFYDFVIVSLRIYHCEFF